MPLRKDKKGIKWLMQKRVKQKRGKKSLNCDKFSVVQRLPTCDISYHAQAPSEAFDNAAWKAEREKLD